jgi:UDP-N-acetyl-alpha-D-muramoyl-L-alanyl-L-glutamate epimerase
MTTTAGAERFIYDHYEIDPPSGQIRCHYEVGPHQFTETFFFDVDGNWTQPAVEAVARLLFLLAGVSYFKTLAPPVIDLGATPTTETERDFLLDYHQSGLGEFATKNDLDLSDLAVVGGTDLLATSSYQPTGDRPLVPFGGGIDSIVVAESVRARHADTALFVASRAGDRFQAIEDAADVSGLPVLRADRSIDDKVLNSDHYGFLNGHIPVTAIISTMAVMAAVLDGRSAVVMSNEWSASSPTVVVNGQEINHQWSKSLAFESSFRRLLAHVLGSRFTYFSLLRPYSELWVARRFAQLTQYHSVFRSCNRSFRLDPSTRLDHWCGECDKCCFIDLILSPYVEATRLRNIFDGIEPLERPELADRFISLIGTSDQSKPFECVGDEEECRVATVLAASRQDRIGTALLAHLAKQIGHVASAVIETQAARLLRPMGEHYIPGEYAPEDRLVRTQ